MVQILFIIPSSPTLPSSKSNYTLTLLCNSQFVSPEELLLTAYITTLKVLNHSR